MVVTLEVLTDIYSQPDKDGNTKMIKKDVIYRKQFDTTSMLVENYTNPKGQIVKKYCIVKQDENYYKLNHSFEEIERLTQPLKFNGFKYGTKGRKGK